MTKSLTQLTSQQWEFLTSLHKRVAETSGEVQQQRYEIFRNKVYSLKRKDIDTSEFERYVKIYDKTIPDRDGAVWAEVID